MNCLLTQHQVAVPSPEAAGANCELQTVALLAVWKLVIGSMLVWSVKGLSYA